MKEIIYWLKQIYDALVNVASATGDVAEASGASHQADWTEDDTTSASYIQHKPVIAPAIIVEGVLDTTGDNPVFEPDNDAPEWEDVADFLAAGKGVAYLSYSGVLEMITLAGADALSGSETSWPKPVASNG
jgi:hypothetical protein